MLRHNTTAGRLCVALIALTIRRQQTFDSFLLAVGSYHSFLLAKPHVPIYNLYIDSLGLSILVSHLPPASKTVFASSASVPEDEFPIKLLRIQV